MRLKACSRCCGRADRARRGLTLIEVVAAIAILGTILVGVVLAKSRHTRQIALTQQRAAAVRAADELIGGWWSDPEGVPVGDSGTFGPEGSLRWETREVGQRRIEAFGARVVRVEVRDADRGAAASSETEEALLAVELVLPEEDGSTADPSGPTAPGEQR